MISFQVGVLAKVTWVFPVCAHAHFPSSTAFIKFSKGSMAAKETKNYWFGQSAFLGVQRVPCFSFYLNICHGALRIVEAPKFVTLINIKMGMCYRDKY